MWCLLTFSVVQWGVKYLWFGWKSQNIASVWNTDAKTWDIHTKARPASKNYCAAKTQRAANLAACVFWSTSFFRSVSPSCFPSLCDQNACSLWHLCNGYVFLSAVKNKARVTSRQRLSSFYRADVSLKDTWERRAMEALCAEKQEIINIAVISVQLCSDKNSKDVFFPPSSVMRPAWQRMDVSW